MRKTPGIVAVWVLALATPWLIAADDPLAAAQTLLRRGDYGGAAQAYQTLVAQQPKSPAVHAGLTLALLKQEKIDEALANAQAAVKAMPDASTLHSALGDVYFRKALIVEAEEAYRKAAQLDKKNPRAWLGMGRISAGVSQFKTAKQYYDYAYSLDPGDPDVLWQWAATRKNRKDEVTALEKLLATVANEDPDDLEQIQGHLQLHKEIGEQKLFQLVSKYGKSEIPMTLLLDGPYRVTGVALRVRFNGGSEESLLIDTGASGLVLNRKAAEKYGIKRLTATKLEGIGDKGPVEGYLGFAERVQVGEVELHNCLVHVSDRSNLVGEAGLIGPDVFSKFLVTLDFAGRKVRLNPLPKREDEAGEDEFYDRVIPPEQKDFTPVFRAGSYLFIPTRVGKGPPTLFLIDTGATFNMISHALARTVTKVNKDSDIEVRGVSGKVKQVYTADRVFLQFGRFRQENQDVTAFDLSSISKSSGMEISGTLGLPLLSLFTLTIDYRNGLINFEYKPPIGTFR